MGGDWGLKLCAASGVYLIALCALLSGVSVALGCTPSELGGRGKV